MLMRILSNLTFQELSSISKQSDAVKVMDQLSRIEKRTFPTSEALQFGPELWRKKPNTCVIYAEMIEQRQGHAVGDGKKPSTSLEQQTLKRAKASKFGGHNKSGASSSSPAASVSSESRANSRQSSNLKPNLEEVARCKTQNRDPVIVAYVVYVRHRDHVLLHKVCVLEKYRGCGVGKQMMKHVIEERLGGGKRGHQNIILWVDEARRAARRLYEGCGFVEVERVDDYYGVGRRGIKMELKMGG